MPDTCLVNRESSDLLKDIDLNLKNRINIIFRQKKSKIGDNSVIELKKTKDVPKQLTAKSELHI